MSLAGFVLSGDVPSEPLVKKRKRVSPNRAFPKRKKKLRETPQLDKAELARAHRLLKSYLVARKSNLERGRNDEGSKLEVLALQGHLDYLRNLDKND
jgi:hypothetical protein